MSERITLKKHLEEQIRQRFAPESKLGIDNTLIQTIFKMESHEETFVQEKLAAMGSVFNPNFKLLNYGLNDILGYNVLGEKYPDFVLKKGFPNYMELAGIPKGYTSKYFGGQPLKKIWKKISSQNIDLVVIGYGGAMTNILYNLSLLGDAFDNRTVFNSIKVFEDDHWSVTNVMRISKPIMHRAFSSFQLQYDVLPKTSIIDAEFELAEVFQISNSRFKKEDIQKILEENPNTIFMGAPDLETRVLLEEANANFIMVGHSGNGVRITKNPKIEGAISETYGTIDVPVLLCNLWAATYKLVELFSNIELIENQENNTEFYEFDFNQIDQDKISELKKLFTEDR